ncbi:MAG: hypothetical protein DRN17_08335 [Thermoplasmata archaeon]|nr:MAG: hypothetical protein DRN17_08335 [Thermoplasmata archaeon]
MELDGFVKRVLENIYGLSGEEFEFLEDKFPEWNKCFVIDDNTYWGLLFQELMSTHLSDKGYLDLIVVMAMFRPSKNKNTAEQARNDARRVPGVVSILKKSKKW